MISNSEQYAPMEHVHGLIGGVDFGPRTFVVARSECSLLLWLAGHSWSVNGHRRYAASHLTVVVNRVTMDVWRNYFALEPRGGRLTVSRVEAARDKVCETFGEDRWHGILRAVKTKQTLIIAGGGAALMPSPSLGRQAYLDWRAQQCQ